MTEQPGHRIWVFPSGCIPATGTGTEPEFTSREELCLLNPGPQDVTAEIEVLRDDEDPSGPFTLAVGARRVRHVRINDLFDPVPVPLGVPYGLIVRTEHPVVAQVVRTDTRRDGLTVSAMQGYGTG
ncbi:sensory rhodopsin transducer [Pseudactinotalea sp. Z1748]|uniref:sensory rhodopsin transducer n=1 Tax=Pseudactinotalea sp. Z1748 TaxID=3413027 RepID=UPI003C7B1BCA